MSQVRVPQPGESLGRYRIDRVLGQGGMGIVFAATDDRLGRTVALKVITGPLAHDPAFLRRFHTEAEVLSTLDSPHVIGILDHDTLDDVPFIVTQYVDGPDLSTWLADRGALPVAEALRLTVQVARGLADAHRSGVIHRDLKPANVLLRAPGTPEEHGYLCDFGVAQSLTSGTTATRSIAGSWAYLAPERLAGAPASVQSDLYSLGCLLWACLTGGPPYDGTDAEVAIAQVQAPVPQLVATHAAGARINEVLRRLLAKDPADRYHDTAAARTALEELAADPAVAALEQLTAPPAAAPAGQPPEPPPLADGVPTASPPAPPATRRSRRGVLVAAVALLVLVAGGAAVWTGLSADDDASSAPEPKAGVEGDLDGDGYGDVLAIERDLDETLDGVLWTVRSTGRSFRAAEAGRVEIGAPSLADIDGDGRLDQVWWEPAAEGEPVSLRVRSGTGALWNWATELDAADDGLGRLASFGDLTGDGREDLVIEVEDAKTSLLLVAASTGRGFDEPRRWYAGEPAATSYPIATGDLDGDGDDDVVWLDDDTPTTDLVRVLSAEDGELVPGEPTSIPDATWEHASWLSGDVDGDGDDDLVAVNGLRGQVGVLALDDGVLAAPRTVWTSDASAPGWRAGIERQGGSPAPDRYALSDVDGDGDADLVRFDSERRTTLSVYVAHGGSFAAPVSWGELPCGDCSILPRMVD